jgi:hypothetical protein
MPHVENNRVVESRPAVIGHDVRYVLPISMLAVIVLLQWSMCS